MATWVIDRSAVVRVARRGKSAGPLGAAGVCVYA
jgi:hypothetical protein